MLDISYQYQGMADEYDRITRVSGYNRVPPRLVSVFQQAAGFTPDMKVLDFGCGTGKLSQAIFDAGAQVDITGMEPCREMADRFSQRFENNPHVTLQDGGYRNRLMLEDESFDAVLSSGVFDHIKITPDVMKEFMRVLKPKGFLAFTYERHSRLFPSPQISWLNENFYSHKDSYVKQCLEDAGAKVVEHQRLFGYFYYHLARMGLFVAQKPG